MLLFGNSINCFNKTRDKLPTLVRKSDKKQGKTKQNNLFKIVVII